MLYLNNIYIIIMQISMFVLFYYLEKSNNNKSIFNVSIIYVLFDEFMHVYYYSIIMFPFVNNIKLFYSGAIVCILIDLDHFIQIKSFQIKKAISMPKRPPTHSLLYAIFFALIVYILGNFELSLGVFLGINLHLVRDFMNKKKYYFLGTVIAIIAVNILKILL